MQAERHALEACVLELAGKSAALERWLADNEKKAVTGEHCCPHHVIGLWWLTQGSIRLLLLGMRWLRTEVSSHYPAILPSLHWLYQ